MTTRRMSRAVPVVLMLIVLAAGYAGWHWQVSVAADTAAPQAMPAPALPVALDDGAVAQQAALAATQTLAGVQQRPDFVSAVEWEVLRALAAGHATPAAELDRLVNQLRFHKQLAWWQEALSAPPAARQQVAEALLAALPARVAAGDLTQADARALQQNVLLALEPDAGRRADRLASEGERIGIVQAIRPVH